MLAGGTCLGGAMSKPPHVARLCIVFGKQPDDSVSGCQRVLSRNPHGKALAVAPEGGVDSLAALVELGLDLVEPDDGMIEHAGTPTWNPAAPCSSVERLTSVNPFVALRHIKVRGCWHFFAPNLNELAAKVTAP